MSLLNAIEITTLNYLVNTKKLDSKEIEKRRNNPSTSYSFWEDTGIKRAIRVLKQIDGWKSQNLSESALLALTLKYLNEHMSGSTQLHSRLAETVATSAGVNLDKVKTDYNHHAEMIGRINGIPIFYPSFVKDYIYKKINPSQASFKETELGSLKKVKTA
jgi:hypothetical protein